MKVCNEKCLSLTQLQEKVREREDRESEWKKRGRMKGWGGVNKRERERMGRKKKKNEKRNIKKFKIQKKKRKKIFLYSNLCEHVKCIKQFCDLSHKRIIMQSSELNL